MRDDLMLYTNPLPGSGVLLAFILNILDSHLPRKDHDRAIAFDNHLTYHRTVEAFKFAFAQRAKLGDPVFEPDVRKVPNKTANAFINWKLNAPWFDGAQTAADLVSKDFASQMYGKIDDHQTYNNPKFYGTVGINPDDEGGSHISVLDRDGLAVSVTASINRQ